ncbi:MAG: nucleotide exchange factor GrpE [Clostridia bacterium]|nr:nucleotide exchange factor GrpE [Clostridia bacterium]
MKKKGNAAPGGAEEEEKIREDFSGETSAGADGTPDGGAAGDGAPAGEDTGNQPEDENARKLSELNDRYLRLYAEYDNYRKRTSKEKEAIYGDCVVRVTAEWLPVIDNLERAADSAARFEGDVDRSIAEGINLVLRQASECMCRLGVEPIAAVGQPFDPELHEAVMQVEQDGVEPGTVVEEFQKGYRRGDRVIRHSMVKVANGST